MSGDRELGPIGTNVVYEDERVRVWRLKLAPGEDSATHRHDLDHLLIQIRGDRVAVVPEPDTAGPYSDVLEADVLPGMVTYVPAGGVETARNVGADPYLEIIVELKGEPGE
jgi:mannose-6-phosphate isomerase-like protein (cupin superfamily)